MARILIIDDDPDILVILDTYFNLAGHTTRELSDAMNVIEAVREFQPDLVVTDILMPGVGGGAVYQALRNAFGPGLPILVVSALKTRLKAERDALLRYCPKPIDQSRLLKEAETLLAAAATFRSEHSSSQESR